MKERIDNIIKMLVYIAAIIFIAFCINKKPAGLGDYYSYISYSVTLTSLFFFIYEKFLWRYIPWNRPPMLKRNYAGEISYIYEGKPGKKSMRIVVKQTCLTIRIETETDINESYTVTGNIVHEYGKNVLYYTYITNPSALQQKSNPIQHGTCRMVLNDDNKTISGNYWTSIQTAGDIFWEELVEDV